MIQPRLDRILFETYEEVAEGFEDLLAPLELFLIESIKVIWI